MVHVDAVPAEDMSAVGHLWCFKIFFKANRALEFILGVVNHLFDLLPFAFAHSLEVRHTLDLVSRQRIDVQDEGESSHKAFLAVLHSVSGLCGYYLAALYLILLRRYSV